MCSRSGSASISWQSCSPCCSSCSAYSTRHASISSRCKRLKKAGRVTHPPRHSSRLAGGVGGQADGILLCVACGAAPPAAAAPNGACASRFTPRLGGRAACATATPFPTSSAPLVSRSARAAPPRTALCIGLCTAPDLSSSSAAAAADSGSSAAEPLPPMPPTPPPLPPLPPLPPTPPLLLPPATALPSNLSLRTIYFPPKGSSSSSASSSPSSSSSSMSRVHVALRITKCSPRSMPSVPSSPSASMPERPSDRMAAVDEPANWSRFWTPKSSPFWVLSPMTPSKRRVSSCCFNARPSCDCL